MIPFNRLFRYKAGIAAAFLAMAMFPLSSCSKLEEKLPGGVASDAFNFYTVSDVLKAAYGSANPHTTAVFVDSLRAKPSYGYISETSVFPVFDYSKTDTYGAEFPSDLPAFTYLLYASYNHLPKGHPVFFTDTASTVLKDTLLLPTAKSYTTVYFADAPAGQGGAASFHVFAYTEDRFLVPEGKTGVRFINLSPDAGTFSCKLSASAGEQSLVPSLSYGQASDYFYLDSTAETGQNLLVFNFSNATTGASLRKGVAFSPGHRYLILLAGSLNDRQVVFNKQTLVVPGNLRVIVRNTY